MMSSLLARLKSTFSYTGLANDPHNPEHPEHHDKKTFWELWKRGEWTLVTVVYWVAFVYYIFRLPWMADKYNQQYWWNPPRQGGLTELCHTSIFTPGLECRNGQDLIELAARHNRTWICGCGQGLFGEALCPLVPGGFSVSFFISSSNGTGLFTFLSFWPMMTLWWYHDWVDRTQDVRKDLMQYSWVALWGLQLFYGAVCYTQICFFPVAHAVCWAFFMMLWFTHIGLTWYTCWLNPGLRKASQVMATTVVIVIFANIGMLMSSHMDCNISFHVCTWGYWFFECIQLTAISGLSVFLEIFSEIKIPPPI